MIRLASCIIPGVVSWLRNMPTGTEIDAQWIEDKEGNKVGLTIRAIDEMDLKIHHYNEKA